MSNFADVQYWFFADILSGWVIKSPKICCRNIWMVPIWNLQAHRDPEQLVPAGQAEQGPPFLYIDFPIQFPPI